MRAQYHGGFSVTWELSAPWRGYHEYCGGYSVPWGYHEYRVGCLVPWRYSNNKRLCPHGTEYPHGTHDIPPHVS